MARDFRFGVRITGDDRGAVRAMSNVGQRSHRLNEQLGNLNRRTRTTSERFRGWASSMSRAVTSIDPLRAAVGGAGLAAGLGFMIKRTTAAADETQRLADIAGVATGEFSSLAAVMERAGGNAPALSDAIKELQVRSSEFASQGTGEAAESFEALFGDEAREKVERLQDDAGAFFRETLERISEIDSQARRTQLLDELFGGQGGEQLVLLLERVNDKGGEFTETLREMEQAAQDSGEALSGENIEALATLNRELDAAGRSIRNSFAKAIADNREDIRSFVDLLGEGAQNAVQFAAGIGAMTDRWESEAASEEIRKKREELLGLIELRNRLRQDFEQGEEIPSGLLIGTGFRGSTLEGFEKFVAGVRSELQGLIDDTIDSNQAQVDMAAVTAEVNKQLQFLEGFSESAGDGVETLTGRVKSSTAQLERFMERYNRLFTNPRDAAGGNFEGRAEEKGTITTAGDVLSGANDETNQSLEEYSRLLDRIDEKAKEMRESGNGLGFAFKSAFEDAIIEGEKFSDVLRGLAEDISRIILRRNVTNKLADSVSDVDFGQLIASWFTNDSSMATGTGSSPAMATGSSSFAGGGYTGDGSRSGGLDGRGGFMAMMHPRETVIDHTKGGGGVNLQVNIINEGGERLEKSGTRERTGPDGTRQLDVMVKGSISRLDSQGELDGVFRRHGAQRQGQF